ncbi:MAG: MATE family efflux transporter [Acidobacteria bacterium]|nr:MATE family efflux transporter [Acidobacteriota bacterium]
MLNSTENSVAVTENTSFWSILREAFSGSQRDLTQGSLGKAIFLLSVPMILEMLGESLFAVVDIFFVAKLGADAIAVVGLTEALIVIVYAVAIGISIGATATVARRIGEKDTEGAAQTAIQVLYLGLIVAVIIGIVGVLFAPQLLALMGAEAAVIEQGTNFTRIMLGGNFVIVFLFLINGIFRGAGDAAIAMRVLWLANILNIILAPCFIFGVGFFPELGVTGAAVGTTIGRGCGVLYALYALTRRGGRFNIQRKHLTFVPRLVWRLAKLSASATVQMLIGMTSWIGLIRIVSGFGTDAIAGYLIGIRVIIFALLPSVGLSNAAATLVGQSLGAGKPDRAEKAVWTAAFCSAGFLTIVGILLAVFAKPIVGIFTTETIVAGYASDCLLIVSLGFLFYGFGMVIETSFNGAGDTVTPTYLNLFIFWLFEIPLAYVLAYHFGLEAHGVFWAITIAFSMLAIVSAILFRRGKWKTKIV